MSITEFFQSITDALKNAGIGGWLALESISFFGVDPKRKSEEYLVTLLQLRRG